MPYSHLTNAIISDPNAAAMLEKPVSVRDGDDLIQINLGENTEVANQEVETEAEELEVETEVENDEESENESESEEEDDESGTDEGEGAESSEDELPEYHKIDPKTMDEAAQMMREAEAGQADLTAKALEAGLAPEALETIKAEYEKDGKLSDKSFEALAKAGFSKSFVESYMAGQEAVADRYIQTLMGHVGGQENFNKVTAFIAKNQPDVAVAFDAAIERNDVATVRALLDAAVGQMRQSPASKAPKRNIANAAKPAKPSGSKSADKVEGFQTRAEMVAAMKDPRYAKDAEYRREVEKRVLHAMF
ncbi:capsid assembly scaffolding protein [Aeromonas phage JELG-KS1]|uniref:Capsid assembly scaffolding protein n=1 Tax=Aeromonas phage JELG-KS1 TaxID=2951233 RepID=A0A9E7NM27_9CAUD|nr:capsid assembly scaffolding protein [Aeromonas phage JELG-KS1]